MHTLTFVLGDHVEERLAAQAPAIGADFWSIGGRYTGLFVLRPGASGRVYGDAIPAAELALSQMAAEAGGIHHRPGADPTRSGVDQARIADISEIPMPGLLLDLDDHWSQVPEELRSWSLRRWMEEEIGSPHAPVPVSVQALEAGWRAQVTYLLDAAGSDCLLTVVDIHR